MEQTAVPLPRGTNPHRQHSKGFPREGFPSSSQGGWQQHFAIPTSVLCPCPQPVVTPLETPQNLSGGWVQPQLLALLLPSPPASLVQPQHQRGDSSRERQPWIPLDLPPDTSSRRGCSHSTWGLHSHTLPAFPWCFGLLFNQPNSLLGLSTPTTEAGGSGEGGGWLAPMATGCPGAALEFDGSCRFSCSSWVCLVRR